MAQLHNLHRFTFDPSAACLGHRYTVGNNRTVELDALPSGRMRLTCRLHGHPVAVFTECPGIGGTEIRLDPCGYRTTTTRQAMTDFLGAMGHAGGVSFAKGEFSAYVDRSPHIENAEGVIEFTIGNAIRLAA